MTTHFKNIIQNMLSIRGTYLIPGCSYVECMPSLAQQPRSRIENDFQKTRVTGPWDHKVSVSAKKVKIKFPACVPLTCSAMGSSSSGWIYLL
jgi:hypothetical protein